MKTIMIFDADQDLADMICLALELEGFHTFGFRDAEADFLELVDKIKPGLVLLDFIHTGVFCIKWCHTIKNAYPNLPVVAVSCNNNISEIFSDHGFDDCIPKPFDLDLLYATVRKYIC